MSIICFCPDICKWYLHFFIISSAKGSHMTMLVQLALLSVRRKQDILSVNFPLFPHVKFPTIMLLLLIVGTAYWLVGSFHYRFSCFLVNIISFNKWSNFHVIKNSNGNRIPYSNLLLCNSSASIHWSFLSTIFKTINKTEGI